MRSLLAHPKVGSRSSKCSFPIQHSDIQTYSNKAHFNIRIYSDASISISVAPRCTDVCVSVTCLCTWYAWVGLGVVYRVGPILHENQCL